jgi:ABC-type thiamine transport system ATPase subunit
MATTSANSASSSAPRVAAKSTILRLIAGLDHPDSGEILVGGKHVVEPGRDRGMVFQKYTSFPWLTVQDNVAYGLKINGVPKAERDKTVAKLIQDVGLSGFAKNPIPTHSPAACSSASPSPGPWPSARPSSWWTSPSAPSTRRHEVTFRSSC